MVDIGDEIPSIEVSDQDSNKINLSNIAKKNELVIVYFYPKDNTPGCTKEACSFRDEYSVFKEKNIPVYGVSADSVTSHTKFIGKYNLPFPLLSDPDLKLTKAFGAYGKKRGKMGLIRSTFIIENGKIKNIFGLEGYPKVTTASHANEILESINIK